MELTPQPPGPGAPSSNGAGEGVAARRMLEAGKREHRETTESARRALQVVEQTTEIARSMLVEIHRQGQQLAKTDQGMQAMEKDVHEAGRVIRFMRRWCCFQVLCCCDCFDPDADMDRTRQRRVQAREAEMETHAANLQSSLMAKEEEVHRLACKGDPAFNGDEDAARSELMLTAADRLRRKQAQRHTSLGFGLPGEDRLALQRDTDAQEGYLDRIGTGVETLRVMSLELNGELRAQAPEIDALADRAHAAHDNLGSLSKAARKI